MAITVKHKFVSAIPDGDDTTIVRPSNWNDDHDLVGTVPVANGGTGVSTSSGANSVVLRDANANITTNCLFEGYLTQAASGTPIVLTAASVQNFQITGSGGQTIRLPDATTLPNGALFTFNNNQSSGTIVVQNNSSTTVATINSGGYVTVVLLDNSIAAGSWDRHDSTPSNVSWSTNTLDYPGSITSATWNGNTVAYNRGGTGQSSAFVAGGIAYGASTTALGITSVGTAGQVLTSNGSSAPSWQTNTAAGVTQSDVGTAPNQIPLNQYLGNMAYEDKAGVNITGGTATLSTLSLTNALPVASGGTGVTTSTGTGSVVLGTRPTLTVTGAGFTLQDATDNTKQANFDLSGISTGTTRTYTLPNGGGTMILLNTTGTYTGVLTFSASNQNFGSSTATGTQQFAYGATLSGSTKTVNIGTGGVSGSTTTITIGSTNGTSTTTINGITKQQTYTVATLPSASTSGVGSRSFVTDALAPTFGATVVTGGAVAVPVYSDGSAWKVG